MMQADSEKLRQAWIKAVQNSIATAFREQSESSEGSLVACEFLLQNGANVNNHDRRGRGPLHHATILGHTGQDIEAYIRAKYVEKRFVQKPTAAEQRTKVVSLSRQEKRLSSSSSEYLPPRPPPPTPKMRPASHISEKSADSRIQNSADGSKEMLAFTRSANSLSEPDVPEAGKNSAGLVEFKECSPGLQLYWAAFARNLPDMAEALAQGAEVNWVNTEADKQTPLIQAVQGGSLVACEFLLQNGANVNNHDRRGRGPLHHATILGHTGQVCLFLKRGASQNAVDSDNKTPLSIAVDAANADIVTLLRLAKMNDEMRESEGLYGQPGQYTTNSHTEMQYKKCIQEFISLQLEES
ncbi:UNVERIFIED_CONTAM: hypothetical protein FKN15_065414 [Acipenser sinensis]